MCVDSATIMATEATYPCTDLEFFPPGNGGDTET